MEAELSLSLLMPERMSLDAFQEHCQSPLLAGYRLRSGQTLPSTYDELVSFIGDRLSLEGPPFTVDALTRWVMEHRKSPESDALNCADTNVEHATTVLLIGELADPDEYVASLPE